MKLKYIQISLHIYQHISCYTESKKIKEINISTKKTHQMTSKWRFLTGIKVSFSNQNLKNNIVTPRLLYVNESCTVIKLIWTTFAYNEN